MSEHLKAAINWDFVTHIRPSQYQPGHTLIYFTTGKYVLVSENFDEVADKFNQAQTTS